MSNIQVGIIMGSKSDLPVMQKAADALQSFGIESEINALSAHRTPEAVHDYVTSARERGLKVIIAGAGGAAHLPGVVAGGTILPVIGVPIKATISIDGWDSLLSIVQMPPGVPVATVGLDAARNAGVLAAQIIGVGDTEVTKKLVAYKAKMKADVIAANNTLKG